MRCVCETECCLNCRRLTPFFRLRLFGQQRSAVALTARLKLAANTQGERFQAACDPSHGELSTRICSRVVSPFREQIQQAAEAVTF
jgi:hypothetical protein